MFVMEGHLFLWEMHKLVAGAAFAVAAVAVAVTFLLLVTALLAEDCKFKRIKGGKFNKFSENGE